jgi:hypothetical protein
MSKNDIFCSFVFIGETEEEQDCPTDAFEWIRGHAVPLPQFSTQPVSDTKLLPDLQAMDHDRYRIWSRLFKDRPIPIPTEGAVDECFGALNKSFPSGDEGASILEEVMREIKGK